jgi:hypothetical protein
MMMRMMNIYRLCFKNACFLSDEAMENLQMLHLGEQRRKQMEHELEMSAAQLNKQRLVIRQLEKDKDRLKDP